MQPAPCIILASALVASVPASAQGPAGAAPSAAAAIPNPDEVICERHKQLGSRLAARRVCTTRAQWEKDRLSDRQDLEKQQLRFGGKEQ
jgi:hypothetical protein